MELPQQPLPTIPPQAFPQPPHGSATADPQGSPHGLTTCPQPHVSAFVNVGANAKHATAKKPNKRCDMQMSSLERDNDTKS